MSSSKGKVVVAMSGGVDSSVAAALLRNDGYEVLGVFMRLGSPDGVAASSIDSVPESPKSCNSHKQGCCSVSDAADARRVAGMLGIPLYVLNFQAEFGRVIDYFIDEYNRGRTPNPCVRCNDWLKFGRLADYATAVGADHIASGHYARIGTDPVTATPALLRGRDRHKDQSYVLFGMSRQTLAHTLLPIGNLEKSEVRQIARDLGLTVSEKPDSQEICFVPDRDYAGLLRRRDPAAMTPGDLVDTTGRAVGVHEGHQHFTIGQRRGVGVALGYPIYVVDIDPVANKVTLGPREMLLRSSLIANQLNMLTDRLIPRGESIRCQAKIRYNHEPQPATAHVAGDDELRIHFDEPQSAITPGQAVVLYDNEVVLGGGWIEAAALTARHSSVS
jgi:tRNA-uridine 2-sulfurtransferase